MAPGFGKGSEEIGKISVDFCTPFSLDPSEIRRDSLENYQRREQTTQLNTGGSQENLESGLLFSKTDKHLVNGKDKKEVPILKHSLLPPLRPDCLVPFLTLRPFLPYLLEHFQQPTCPTAVSALGSSLYRDMLQYKMAQSLISLHLRLPPHFGLGQP